MALLTARLFSLKLAISRMKPKHNAIPKCLDKHQFLMLSPQNYNFIPNVSIIPWQYLSIFFGVIVGGFSNNSTIFAIHTIDINTNH